IVALAFGSEFRQAAGAVRWLGGLLPLVCFARVLIPALAARGRAMVGVWIEIAGLAVNAGLILLRTGTVTLEWVLVSVTVSRVMTFLLYLAYARRMSRVK